MRIVLGLVWAGKGTVTNKSDAEIEVNLERMSYSLHEERQLC
jgi:hypothetical protein